MTRALLRLLGLAHSRGYHPAVIAGLVMMPAVAVVGFWTDRIDRHPDETAATVLGQLRGTIDGTVPQPKRAGERF